jgi:glycolate oxidase iron-sulfur subunit
MKKSQGAIPREEILRMIEEDAKPGLCVLCGKCASLCPSFREWQREIYSPRGRMALLNAFLRGEIAPGDEFFSSLLYCLGCGACEKTCPARVRPRWANLLLKNLPEFQGVHAKLRKSLRDSEKRDFPVSLIRKYFDLQHKPQKPFSQTRKRNLHKQTKNLHEVLYFPSCIRRHFLPDSCESLALLLEKAGCRVFVPEKVSCCGLPHVFTGELGLARDLAGCNMKLFDEYKDISIVCDCASCALIIKSYPLLFPKGTQSRDQADALSSRVHLISEFLLKIGFLFEGKTSVEDIRLAYLDSGALRYGLGAAKAPRKILDALPGVNRMETPGDVSCPGVGLWSLSENKDFLDSMFNRKILDFCTKKKVETLIVEDSLCQLILSRHMPSFQILSFSEFVLSRLP